MMDCLDEVNFNLVPADRASTANLGIDRQCPACDNYRSTHPSYTDDNNSNCPTSLTSIGTTQSTVRSLDCSCTSTLNSHIGQPRIVNPSPECQLSPHKNEPHLGSTSPRDFQLELSPASSLRHMSSSPSSSKSPSPLITLHPPSSSTYTSTTMNSLAHHSPNCLSRSQCHQNHTCNTLSCHKRLPRQSSTTDSLGSFEGLSPPDTTITSTAYSSKGFARNEFPDDQHGFSGTDHASILSPFRLDSNPENTLLFPPESSQSSHHPHQSKPIPIQHKSSTSHSSRYLHHNDTDLTEGLSLTPSAYADRLTLSSWDTTSGSQYNPFASSPAERLSLHFYSQQSPKYFKLPSSSCSPMQHGHLGHGHEIRPPTKPIVFDRWPIGLSNKKARQVKEGVESKSPGASSSIPKKTRNTPIRNEASHRRRPDSSWKSRWMSEDDGSSGEDDITMTPVEGPIFDSCATKHAPADATPMRHLPQEFLYQLHTLEHQNEDLSADVIFALESKGFVIHEVLGKGISSTVRRVTEKDTGQEYAAKIIDISGEKGDSDVVEQTKKDTMREIHVLRMCGSHNNIIQLHDVFETPTFIFLVFELCRQGELFDYLTSVVSLSEKRTRIIMRQLLDAVQFIHENRIVHRDLKPENILLDDDLNLKVSDFGFATIVAKGEELGELCGTPGYLAPEVLAHSMYENVSGYGKEVDMWACGVIMYTLLCGAPPFWNRRQMIMLRAIMNADYTFNSPEWDDISEAPKNLIQKLLVVNPKERLTAREALSHPFFQSKIQEPIKFNALRKFRAGVFCVLFYKRLSRFYKHPPPISMDTLYTNPYSIKLIRKSIDTCAFSMYRHWVKRVDNQNRAALFEHTLREEWKQNIGVVASNAKIVTHPHQ